MSTPYNPQQPGQQWQPQPGPPQGPGPAPAPQPPQKIGPWFTTKPIIGLAGLLLGLLIGGIGGSGDTGAVTVQPGTTVTETAPGTEVTVTETAPAPKAGGQVTVTAKPAPGPTVTVTGKAEPPPDQPTTGGEITAGTYVVGEDIKPGTYKARAVDGLCYWARLDKNNEIIDNNLTEGRAVVTIKKSDYAFETNSCTAWARQ